MIHIFPSNSTNNHKDVQKKERFNKFTLFHTSMILYNNQILYCVEILSFYDVSAFTFALMPSFKKSCISPYHSIYKNDFQVRT